MSLLSLDKWVGERDDGRRSRIRELTYETQSDIPKLIASSGSWGMMTVSFWFCFPRRAFLLRLLKMLPWNVLLNAKPIQQNLNAHSGPRLCKIAHVAQIGPIDHNGAHCLSEPIRGQHLCGCGSSRALSSHAGTGCGGAPTNQNIILNRLQPQLGRRVGILENLSNRSLRTVVLIFVIFYRFWSESDMFSF